MYDFTFGHSENKTFKMIHVEWISVERHTQHIQITTNKTTTATLTGNMAELFIKLQLKFNIYCKQAPPRRKTLSTKRNIGEKTKRSYQFTARWPRSCSAAAGGSHFNSGWRLAWSWLTWLVTRLLCFLLNLSGGRRHSGSVPAPVTQTGPCPVHHTETKTSYLQWR